SLREYGCVVIDRAIFRAKNQAASDSVTLGDLGHLTIGKALAIEGAQGKKAMHQAFHVAHGYLVSGQRACLEWYEAGQHEVQHAKPEMPYLRHFFDTVCSPDTLFNLNLALAHSCGNTGNTEFSA